MSVDQLSAVLKSEQASAIATIAPGSEPDGEGIVKVLSESVSPEKRADLVCGPGADGPAPP